MSHSSNISSLYYRQHFMSRKRIPKLALVGRPNVGKSALFNRISKKRIAIVDEAEGVTRDRLYAEADCFGKPFEVIDTGGIISVRNSLPRGDPQAG